MLNKSIISKVIEDQVRSKQDGEWIERDTKLPLDSKRIIIVSGVRRCGKSTLVKQILDHGSKSLYINFEDPRLVSFDSRDFIRLEELMKDQDKTMLLLDEVQNVSEWEIYARSANERKIPMIITGSNASLLSRELGTKLTGRYKQVELFPFSYQEFLRYTDMTIGEESTSSYLELGGFPEHLAEKDKEYHRILLRDIISRDIALRRNITNETQLLRLSTHLLSSIGKDFSYNNLSRLLEFKSVRTVIDYCDYLQDSYLVEYVPMYATSIKKQIANPKKVYAIDPAFAWSNSLSFSQDLGRRLENMVYLKLRYSHRSIFYYRNQGGECDFLVKEDEKIHSLIQVCWDLNLDNQEREIRGLQQAMTETGATNGIIVTFNQEDELEGIPVVPAWKWL